MVLKSISFRGNNKITINYFNFVINITGYFKNKN